MKFRLNKKVCVAGALLFAPLELHCAAGYYGMNLVSAGYIANQALDNANPQNQPASALLAKNLDKALGGISKNSVLLVAETNHCDTKMLRALSSQEVLREFRHLGTAIIQVELSKAMQSDLDDAARGEKSKIDGVAVSSCGDKIGEEQAELYATLALNAKKTGIYVSAGQPIMKSLKLSAVAFNWAAVSTEANILGRIFPSMADSWEKLGERLFVGVDLNDKSAANEAGIYAHFGALPVVYGGALHMFANTEDSFGPIIGNNAKTVLWNNGSNILDQKLSGCEARISDDVLAIAAKPDIAANVNTGEVQSCTPR